MRKKIKNKPTVCESLDKATELLKRVAADYRYIDENEIIGVAPYPLSEEIEEFLNERVVNRIIKEIDKIREDNEK